MVDKGLAKMGEKIRITFGSMPKEKMGKAEEGDSMHDSDYFVSKIREAIQEIESGNPRQAVSILKECLPEGSESKEEGKAGNPKSEFDSDMKKALGI
jgi:hypothetical protein